MAAISSVEFYVLALLVIGMATVTPSQISKIEPSLLQIYQRDFSVKINIILEMREGNANTLRRVDALRFSSRTEKISTMNTQLKSLAETSQKGITSILEEDQADFISFWINNRVFVRDASWELIKKLEKDPEVLLIREEEIYHLPHEVATSNTNTSIKAIWSLENIEAPQAWGMKGGNKGEGIVIAIIDTGVRRTHVDLHSNFREDHGWFDGVNGQETPIDEVGSGTILTGSAVGANNIGVAPGAQWIACRACDHVSCRESALLSCAEWIVCPTRPNGENADCSKAPHISSNAWGGSRYLEVVNAWHSAGIIPVFSIGSGGPGCETTMPPGNYENVIGVGATDMSNTIYYGSGRGPALSGSVKPDICAPGVGIWSASSLGDNDYAFTAGTGFASPHVAGAVAILLSRNSSLSFEQVKNILEKNTELDLGDAEMCGGTLPSYFPNNIYGHGKLNVRKALEALSNDVDSSAPNHQPRFKINPIISVAVLIYLQLHVKIDLFPEKCA